MRQGRIGFIINEGAGSTDDSVTERLRAAGYAVYEGDDLSRAAEEAVMAGCQTVVACGGDGTVSAVLAAIVGKDINLGIVPMGTGNVIALALGIPSDIDEAIQVVGSGEPRPVDVGFCESTPFLIGAGLGVAEEFTTNASSEEKATIGKWAYVKALLQAYKRPKFRLTLEVDGQCHQLSCVSAVVSSLWKLGPVDVLPDSTSDDGRFEALIHESLSLKDMLMFGLGALAGRATERNEVRIFQGSVFRLETHPEQAVQLDGNEPAFKTPVSLEAGKAQVRVWTPQSRT